MKNFLKVLFAFIMIASIDSISASTFPNLDKHKAEVSVNKTTVNPVVIDNVYFVEVHTGKTIEIHYTSSYQLLADACVVLDNDDTVCGDNICIKYIDNATSTNIKSTPTNMQDNIQIVFIGDAGIGKTAITEIAKNTDIEHNIAFVNDNFFPITKNRIPDIENVLATKYTPLLFSKKSKAKCNRWKSNKYKPFTT